MHLQDKCLRVGAVAIGCAVLLRLLSGGAVGNFIRAISAQQVLSAVVFLETGRVIKPADTATTPTETAAPTVAETTAPTVGKEEPVKAVFGESDADLVAVNSVCGYDADVSDLLEKPLQWDLTADEPTVLIIHTHGTESYQKTENYTESSAYRTRNTKYNVVSVGARLKKQLEKAGISVLHDKTMHDSPSYSAAYPNARESVEKYLKKYPSIRLVLDVHRDSVEDSAGREMDFDVTVAGKKVAKLMFVVGTDAGGFDHPNWPQNMALAVKLHAQLEKNTAGICRSISFRSQRFNQDLSPGFLIVEVGSAGNTRAEALRAADLLAAGIVDLAGGT